MCSELGPMLVRPSLRPQNLKLLLKIVYVLEIEKLPYLHNEIMETRRMEFSILLSLEIRLWI